MHVRQKGGNDSGEGKEGKGVCAEVEEEKEKAAADCRGPDGQWRDHHKERKVKQERAQAGSSVAVIISTCQWAVADPI